MSVSGQVAIVTGASRGIGRAIARRLARGGIAVCVNYAARAADAEAVVAEIRTAGGRGIAMCADVGDPAQVRDLVGRAERELGPVSVLVNNAGISSTATLETFEPAAMERMRRTNVDGVIHMTRAVVPAMKERRYGRIVNLSSVAAHGTTQPGNTFYAATKAAVVTLTRRFAMELGSYGITVNAVAPGFIHTDMATAGRTAQEYRDLAKAVSAVTMVGRIGDPDEVANAVVFLTAPESGFITAQVLTVDGGRMEYIGHP
jgi:3-oxoacyl-[acyl-carrier protein] reductase